MKIIIVLVLVAILLVSCMPSSNTVSDRSKTYFKSKHIENSNLTRIVDPEFGVVCYWFAASGVSSTLSCVKALE